MHIFNVYFRFFEAIQVLQITKSTDCYLSIKFQLGLPMCIAASIFGGLRLGPKYFLAHILKLLCLFVCI
jgi:hypothetical protein